MGVKGWRRGSGVVVVGVWLALEVSMSIVQIFKLDFVALLEGRKQIVHLFSIAALASRNAQLLEDLIK